MKKRFLWLLPAVLLILLAVWLLAHLRSCLPQPKVLQDSSADNSLEGWKPDQRPAEGSAEDPLEKGESSLPDPVDPYESPIDFDALHEVNPEIYAWLSIPETNIDYPVLQSENDRKYLDHGESGELDVNGAIFSESRYNGTDLTDPITVLYGHRMNSGAMFGELQMDFGSMESFDDMPLIYMYLPDGEKVYRVFACVPYTNAHILYYYSGTDPLARTGFLNSLEGILRPDTRIDRENLPEKEQPILVLSTCLAGDRTKRFIVAAAEISSKP